MNTNDMTQVCHRNTYLSPDIEGKLEQYDIKIDQHSENIEDREKLLIIKLKRFSIDLKNAQYKLCEQEREIKLLRVQLKKEGGCDYVIPGVCDSETLYDIERNNVCQYTSSAKEDTEMTKMEMHKIIDNLIEETESLKRQMSTKDIEIRQLGFRYKLSDDILKESKLGKRTKFCNVLYEKAYLQEHMEFLQEDNLKKDEELLKARRELKRAQEWKMDMSDKCTIKARLTAHKQEIRSLQETIKRVVFLKDEIQVELNKSLQKEAELQITVSQLEDENKEKEKKINIMTYRLNRNIGIIHDNKDERHALKELKQSKREIEYEREKTFTKQMQMSKIFEENEHLKKEILRKDRDIQELTDFSKSTETLKKETEAKMSDMRSEANKQTVYLQEQLKQSRNEIASLRVNCNKLKYSNQQKDFQISELKHETERNTKTLQERESEMQRLLKDAKCELETCKKEIEMEKNQSKIEMTKLGSEIEYCYLKIKEKESDLVRLGVEYRNRVELKEQEEHKLRDIISRHFRDIKNLEKELEKRNVEIFAKEKMTQQKDELKQALNQSHEVAVKKDSLKQALDRSAQMEEALRKTVNELRIVGHSLQMQKENAEERLKHFEEQMEYDKEKVYTIKRQMCKEIEDLKKELTEKETALQDIHIQYHDSVKLQEEMEMKLNGVISQKELEIKEKKCQITELKCQLKEITETSQQRESELRKINSSLKLQLKTMERDLKKLTLDITYGNERARTNKKRMEKMNDEIKSLQLTLKEKESNNKNLKDDIHQMKKEETKLNSIAHKQRNEIKDLKGKIEEKDLEVTHVDQSKELELFQQELNKSKEEELDLREINQVLRNRNAEIEMEVTDLKKQVDEISKTSNQTEHELRNINLSLEQQVKNSEIRLEQQQLEISHEKELTLTNQTRIEQLSEEIECLKLTMKEKDKTLQKYHERFEDANQCKEEAVSKLNIVVNKQKKEIQHLQEEVENRDMKLASVDQVNKRSYHVQQALNESHGKESELSKTINALQRGYQEKEDQISNLKSQVNELTDTFNKREAELNIMNRSLQTQLNTTKEELRQLHKDVSHDKALVSTNQKHMVEMGKEIKKLKQDLEQKEITLQEHNVQYEACIKIKQGEESKLNAIIEEQKCKIQSLKEDIREKNMEVNSIEKIKKQKDQIQEAFDALRVKETSLCKSSRVLEIKNKEKDEEVTELKQQLDDLRKTSNQKENELKNSISSLKQELNIKETELGRKEVEHSNVKALISTKDKHDATMAGEIDRLKVEVKLKETLLQEFNGKLKDAVKVKEGTESNLKEIIIKQNEDINHLKAKIEMQNNQNVTIDEVENRSKQIQQALNESHKKEAELGRTIDILQRRDKENEGQIRELKDQMNELSNTSKRKENQLQSMISSLQTQLKNTESKLKELHQEKLHEKESLSTYKKQMVGLNKEIESLKQEVKLKDARIHEYDIQCKDALKTKQEAEWKLKEIINKQNNEIQHLQKQIEKKDIEANDIAELKKHNEEVQRAFNDLCEKEADLRKSNKDLHCRNREKEDEVRELKKQLSEMLKTVSQKENESQNIIHSIKQQLKNTEAIMRQQQLDISQEKKLMSTKDKDMVKMTEEIKSLKLQVKQKESTLQKCSEQYTDAVKLKQEAESKLNEIIHNHKTEIRHLQRDIERKDNEIARIEQINIRYEKVKNTLNESQEKEVTFRETIKALENKNQENENRIAELKRKLDKTSEESHKMEIELKETKHLLNGKIKSIETEKDQYKQDIANAKQLSKAAQIKMSEMDTRINDLTNKLKKKEEDLQKGKENLSGIIDSQKEQIQHLEREVQKRERKMKSVQIEKDNELQEMEKNMVELENQMKHMLSKLRDTEAELDETKSRLSRVMGDRLTDNNPNITDLSDRNRPTKIAEKCAELYDNEWTDAFDVLEKLFRTEEAAIEALLLILQNAMHFCKTMAQRQIEFIEREMYFADEKEKIAVSSDIQKLIKDRRKATATAVVGNLKKIYFAELKQSKDKIMRAALDVEPYTSECIEICWFMLIQDPPVVFAPLPIKGSSFDTNFYKPYTKSGTHVDFAVWPALLLHDGGPILAKGVAQGYGNK
ncbi:putative leucine-rich repeat-containing protein DDB_G0290503 [Ruditapes philippinarum]|uniref:putative leucine-rich repeat-containing protein DDB_G0290503 n=1 Tax=Ruditapes philippinarum TaxID=129788 RepID=UPI00295AE2D5|nr:putative leucine-rich repeat-containing protein DDB_G0290503 [Ruditapes philippinarum]